MNRSVYIVGEDEATREIIRRVVKDYAPYLSIIQHIPARGSEIKAKIPSINNVALSYPVILLADMDTNPCAPIAKTSLLSGIPIISPEFVVNIAVDEAEAWLLADREGFSSYFGIPLDKMPNSSKQKHMGPTERVEMSIPLKASYYLTHTLASLSTKKTFKDQLFSLEAIKGPEYNTAIVPFIQHVWDIENARKHSYSLDGMIRRIQAIHP